MLSFFPTMCCTSQPSCPTTPQTQRAQSWTHSLTPLTLFFLWCSMFLLVKQLSSPWPKLDFSLSFARSCQLCYHLARNSISMSAFSASSMIHPFTIPSWPWLSYLLNWCPDHSPLYTVLLEYSSKKQSPLSHGLLENIQLLPTTYRTKAGLKAFYSRVSALILIWPPWLLFIKASLQTTQFLHVPHICPTYSTPSQLLLPSQSHSFPCGRLLFPPLISPAGGYIPAGLHVWLISVSHSTFTLARTVAP